MHRARVTCFQSPGCGLNPMLGPRSTHHFFGEIGAPKTLVFSSQLWFTFLFCNCVSVNRAAVKTSCWIIYFTRITLGWFGSLQTIFYFTPWHCFHSQHDQYKQVYWCELKCAAYWWGDVFEGGRTAGAFTSSPASLGTAMLGPVPTALVILLGVNVLPPLAYPEESEVTWKSKLNNALVQLWKVYSKGWRCSSAVKLVTSLP